MVKLTIEDIKWLINRVSSCFFTVKKAAQVYQITERRVQRRERPKKKIRSAGVTFLFARLRNREAGEKGSGPEEHTHGSPFSSSRASRWAAADRHGEEKAHTRGGGSLLIFTM